MVVMQGTRYVTALRLLIQRPPDPPDAPRDPGFVRWPPLVRPRDVEALGIAREFLLRLYRRGLLVRQARGVYALPQTPVTEHHSLAMAAKRVPRGVICLLSALRFHGLTTQNPHEVWIAIDHQARKPSVEPPALRVVRFSGRALAEDVEEPEIEGVRVRVYSAAKTVADCFKYRHKIGIDVAIEAPQLLSPLHYRTQNAVDPGGVACAKPHEPVVNLPVDASSHQHLWRTAESRQLLVGQGRDVRVIDAGVVSGGLPLRDPRQDGLLLFTRRLAENRLGAHAD